VHCRSRVSHLYLSVCNRLSSPKNPPAPSTGADPRAGLAPKCARAAVREQRGGEPGEPAGSTPASQLRGSLLLSPSPSPYPGRRGTRGCGARRFSPHPAASFPRQPRESRTFSSLSLPAGVSAAAGGGGAGGERRGEAGAGAAREGERRRRRRREVPAASLCCTQPAATAARQQLLHGGVAALQQFRSGSQRGGRCRKKGFISRGC